MGFHNMIMQFLFTSHIKGPTIGAYSIPVFPKSLLYFFTYAVHFTNLTTQRLRITILEADNLLKLVYATTIMF